MDPRRSYPEEPEPQWFGNEQPEWDPRRIPEQRGAADPRFAEPVRLPTHGPRGDGPPGPPPVGHRGDAPPAGGHRDGPPAGGHRDGLPAGGHRGDGPPGPPPAAPRGGGPAIGPRSGEPLPPEPAARHHTEAIDRGALRRSVSDGIYRARRPAVALLVGAVSGTAAVLILVAMVRSSLPLAGVISGVLVLLGLPLGALGMYGLVTGAARVPDASPAHAWLRPPLAYLAVALVLFVAAGLAAG